MSPCITSLIECFQSRLTRYKTMQRLQTRLVICTKVRWQQRHILLECHLEQIFQCRENVSEVKPSCLRIRWWTGETISLWTTIITRVSGVESDETTPAEDSIGSVQIGSLRRRKLYRRGELIWINSAQQCQRLRSTITTWGRVYTWKIVAEVLKVCQELKVIWLAATTRTWPSLLEYSMPTVSLPIWQPKIRKSAAASARNWTSSTGTRTETARNPWVCTQWPVLRLLWPMSSYCRRELLCH